MPLGYKVTVAILNWNGINHLQTFLPSVVENSPEAHILLIDNASTDTSVEWVRLRYPQIEIRIHARNLGFTEGYNQAMPWVQTPFVVLLNSDVEVTSGWLTPLLARMENHPEVAACQPKIKAYLQKEYFEYAGASGGFLDALGYPYCRGRIFDVCEKDTGQYNEPMPICWATGACMMVRMADWHKMNGLEPRFFAHMEEIDLCWRWNHSGKQVWVEPASVVYHLGAGTLSKSNPRKTFFNFRNGLAMLFTNTIDKSVLWKVPLRLALDGLAGLQFLAKGEVRNCLAIIRAHFAFYASIGYWIKKRRKTKHEAISYDINTLEKPVSMVWSFFALKKRHFSDL